MKLNKYIIMSCLGAATLGLATTSCSRDEEITEMSYSRLFSALNLEARVQNQINVKLSWYEVDGAKSYIINVYEAANQEGEDSEAEDAKQFVLVPEGAEVLRSIETTATTYVVEGLTGQTRYVFEIIAVDENGSKSKGICVQAKTGSEQTFRSVLDSEIEATSVTLRWNASDAKGCIIKVKAEGDEEYTVEHEITAEESAAKCAVIEGLRGETTYNARMVNANNKQRGSVDFTTAVDLGGAISVTEDMDLNDVIASAPAGSTLALWPGTYECTDEEGQVKIKVDHSISIKAVKAADRPVIKGCIQISGGASLTMSQVVMDGEGSDGSQAIDYREEGNYDALTVEDCEFRNYTKGFFYINVAAVINTITVNNCLIHDIVCTGGDLFDSRSGGYNAFNLTNTTIYNSATSRDMIRMDDASSKVTATPVITVDHCTFYGVGNGGANYRLLYVRFAGSSINFTNNIVADFNNKRGFSNQKTTPVPTFSKNYYWNTVNLVSLGADNTEAITFFDEKGVELSADPFKNASGADFTLTNEDLNYYGIGDPRWVVK